MAQVEHKSTLVSLLLPVGIALAFIGWGLMVYYTVGDKEPRPWDFGQVPDVPGQSPYSTELKARETGLIPPEIRQAPPQHIDGRTDPVNPYLKGEPDGPR